MITIRGLHIIHHTDLRRAFRRTRYGSVLKIDYPRDDKGDVARPLTERGFHGPQYSFICWDVENDNGPAPDEIARALTFLVNNKRNGRGAIISRSGRSAATSLQLGFMALANPQVHIPEMIDRILTFSPAAYPNYRMIRIMDENLRFGGELQNAVNASQAFTDNYERLMLHYRRYPEIHPEMRGA